MQMQKWKSKYVNDSMFGVLVDSTTSLYFSGDIEYDDVIGIMIMALQKIDDMSYRGAVRQTKAKIERTQDPISDD